MPRKPLYSGRQVVALTGVPWLFLWAWPHGMDTTKPGPRCKVDRGINPANRCKKETQDDRKEMMCVIFDFFGNRRVAHNRLTLTEIGIIATAFFIWDILDEIA